MGAELEVVDAEIIEGEIVDETAIAERVDVKQLWADAFGEELTQTEIQSGVPHEEWTITGRASKDYPNKENLLWWADKGPEMLQAYINWRKATGWDIWTTPDGKKAIELSFEVPWGDGLPLRGYIDRIFIHPFTGTLIVCDIKSGSRVPDDRQLAEYACAVEIEYGVRPEFGMYLMTRTGKGDLVKLDKPRHSAAYLIEQSEQVQKGINAEVFYTVPGMLCASCAMRAHCPEFAEE